MLEFVVPIMYPEKPSRVILTVGNTIFGALSEVRKINWGQVLQEVVGKLFSTLEKGKPSPISSTRSTSTTRMNALEEEK